MNHSLDLLTKLRAKYPDKAEGALALQMGYSRSAFQQAQRAARFSPEMAADIAGYIGESPQHWALVAAAEGAKTPAAKRRLTAMLKSIKKEEF